MLRYSQVVSLSLSSNLGDISQQGIMASAPYAK
ncbi:hypothetical protein A2U01_0119589, partial [Trifolium medium]|nr:hypothetical protein [Trifolium medium]